MLLMPDLALTDTGLLQLLQQFSRQPGGEWLALRMGIGQQSASSSIRGLDQSLQVKHQPSLRTGFKDEAIEGIVMGHAADQGLALGHGFFKSHQDTRHRQGQADIETEKDQPIKVQMRIRQGYIDTK